MEGHKTLDDIAAVAAKLWEELDDSPSEDAYGQLKRDCEFYEFFQEFPLVYFFITVHGCYTASAMREFLDYYSQNYPKNHSESRARQTEYMVMILRERFPNARDQTFDSLRSELIETANEKGDLSEDTIQACVKAQENVSEERRKENIRALREYAERIRFREANDPPDRPCLSST